MWKIALAISCVFVLGATMIGSVFVLYKPSPLQTCSAIYEGGIVKQSGQSEGAATKICVCRSNGSDSYQWCSLSLTDGASVVCTGGSPSVCP